MKGLATLKGSETLFFIITLFSYGLIEINRSSSRASASLIA